MTLCESCSYDLTRAPSTPALDDEIEADTYTLGRLGVLPPRPLLLADRIDLGDALSHLDRLGRLILGGYRVSAPSLEDLGVSGSGVLARGIAMVSDWPRAFHVCLDQVMLQSTTQRDSDAQGANWAYGWAYLWATKLPEDAFSRAIKAEMAKHAGEHLPVRRHIVRLDFDLHPPEHMTMREAADDCGLIYATMRRLCDALGLVPGDMRTGKQFVLAPSQIETIKTALAGSMNLSQVADRLCINRISLARLLEDGVVKPWIHSGRGGLNAHIFRTEDIEAFYSMLRGNAPIGSTQPPGTMPLMKACKTSKLSVHEVCKLIKDGKIAPVCVLKGMKGLDGLLYDLEAMCCIRRSLRPWMSVEEVAEKLNIRVDTATELLRRKFLDAEKIDAESKAFWRVDPESVDEFAMNYVRGSDYAKEFNTTGEHASRRLIALGLKPIVEMGPYQTALFKRNQVELTIQGLATSETWTKETRASFWHGLARTLETKGSFYTLDRGDYGPEANLSLGRTGVLLGIKYQKSRNSIMLALQVNSSMDPDGYDILHAQKDDIEKELGFNLSWSKPEIGTGVWASIENTVFSLSDRANWPLLHDWIAATIAKFRDVFPKRVKTLPGRYRPKMKGLPREKPK